MLRVKLAEINAQCLFFQRQSLFYLSPCGTYASQNDKCLRKYLNKAQIAQRIRTQKSAILQSIASFSYRPLV